MLLGCYDRLISSVSSFTKNKKANFVYLSVFGMGGILGMMLFAGAGFRSPGSLPDADDVFFYRGGCRGNPNDLPKVRG